MKEGRKPEYPEKTPGDVIQNPSVDPLDARRLAGQPLE